MQVQTMEVSLSNELLEGEELVWSGRPAKRGRSIASSPARVFSIIGLIYGAIGLFFLLLGLILRLMIGDVFASGGYIGFVVPGGIFFLLGIIFFLVGRFAHFSNRSAFYAITNRRVIILRGGRYLRVLSYDVRAITQVQRFERPNGSGDLAFSGSFLSSGMHNNMYTMAQQHTMSAIPDVRLAERKLLGVMGKG